MHGGRDYTHPVLIDDEVTKRLHALADLAPLHQPLSLYALGEIRRALSDVPVVACFDTAFHATLPDAAATYALPAERRERFGLRRYGFPLPLARPRRPPRGRTPGNRPRPPAPRGLPPGSGASLTAVAEGRSVDTTMGFTPLRGRDDGRAGRTGRAGVHRRSR
ncbi:hypothetical protein [Actinomadura napierensis]|uniref:Uncharacterized protein n=1 Tax=Actinomadura napierensis TaxID=267854 RepID=A0ABP5KCT5_9ACTN